MAAEPCAIIGVLDNGAASLTPSTLARLGQAQVVIGARRTLTLCDAVLSPDTERRCLDGELGRVPAWVEKARRDGLNVAVLATGDPLCHGIAGFLIRKLGRDACEVLPNLSALQGACARLGLPWQTLHVCSVHSQDAGEWTVGATPEHGLYHFAQAARHHDLLGVYTGPANSPDRLARLLLAEGLGEAFQMSVAEKLWQPEEAIIGPLAIIEAAARRFAVPNVMILRRVQSRPGTPLFGLADHEFKQRTPDKGLITKREVRAVSLARLQLEPASVLWDIGAGSGAVGLEAARLCSGGHVYAIEKNAADVAIAEHNRSRLGVSNYTLVHGKAPARMDRWPAPDAVFIGGSGGGLAELIQLCLCRLKPHGWLVMNLVTVENLATAVATLQAVGADWDVTQLHASRSQPILRMHRLQAENPVWIVSARREAS
ncbi:MAG TPA: precorrin-6y C5,15-methyltransferase (decarboxylating) subunit CbiE [Gammaproteobacteria bacterium]|nr:precorrin-6y C5,15-methyltransferase (decarboxylating) subunit CbiE [Gammaproteobacteria bacterium]